MILKLIEWKTLGRLIIVIGVIISCITFYYTVLPGEKEAIKLARALFLEPQMDYKLIVEEEAKFHFERFSSHFDESKLILLVSMPIERRYDFIVDPEGKMPFMITLTVAVFDKPEFWVHNYGVEGYIKLYEQKKLKKPAPEG